MKYFCLMLSLVCLLACDDHIYKEQTPDVSHINVDFAVHRFDQALLKMDTFAPINSLKTLSTSYPMLTELFLSPILGLSKPDQDREEVAKELGLFIRDRRIRFLLDTIQVIYPNLSAHNDEFAQTFRYMKYYFPEQHIPDIYTIASEYTVGNFLFQDEEGNDALGIGLDFFLGEDYPYRQVVPNNTAFSSYLTRTFNKDHLVKKSIIPLVQDRLGRAEGSRLLDKMIHDGKERYIIDRLMPFAADTVIHEFSLTQLEFCQENEADMWAFFLTEDLLYTQEPHKISKYINPAPTSAGMPAEAPGRAAAYLGYRIVQQYMSRHPETSLTELIGLRDAQDIMTRSKYRPNSI